MAPKIEQSELKKKELSKFAVERSFLPAALEIIETPPSPTGRALLWLICLLVVAGFGWSILSSVDIVAVASGKTVTRLRTQVVQAPQAGVINEILVSSGQEVKDGDPLILLDKRDYEAEAKRAHIEYDQARLDIARNEAFIKSEEADSFSSLTDIDQALVDHARSQLTAQIIERDSHLGSINKEIEQRKSELASAKEELNKVLSILPLVQERAEMRQKLAAMLYGNKVASSEAVQKLLETESEKNTTELKIRSLEFALESLQQNLIQVENDYRQKALADISSAKLKVNSTLETIARSERAIELSTIRAHVDGVVSQMLVRTIGGIVTPAQQLMSIVPKNSELEVVAVVSNQDIGFVMPNQEASIKFDAFPFTRFGMMKGQVVSISQDSEPQPSQVQSNTSLTEPQADQTSNIEGSQRLVYIARIKLSDTDLIRIDDKPVTLIPGMSARVEIKTGRRSVLSYLLSPLRGYASQTFQER